jgi:hypothetical protein
MEEMGIINLKDFIERYHWRPVTNKTGRVRKAK